jgi:hypothetical protein
VRGDRIVVPDAQIAPAHPGGIMIAGKREVVSGIEPAVIFAAKAGKRTKFDH